ncbi:hypothetical protein [Pelagibacterium sp. H642]|uniref:hypothetical protein n=1 Tax=Pelagibacterium sp. H642 TaxID=1881069 RepID=UPI002814AE5C|nr:hypothetical protein [Pelagibacterium sp. H642]WMT92788.1 hypothetical protein NO934_18570 [Pelagibacterium sp. H642]
MPTISDLFFKAAILFLIIGIGIGINMAMSGNHSVLGAHAHINLLGWVTSALFAGYYAHNPTKAEGLLPMVHFGVYMMGVVVMVGSLYLLLSGNVAMEPFVAAGSVVTFVGVLIFAVVVFSPTRNRAGASGFRAPAE